MKTTSSDKTFAILRWLSIFVGSYELVVYGWWDNSDHRFTLVTATAFLLAGAFPDSMLRRQWLRWIAVVIISAGCLGEAANTLNIYHWLDLMDRDLLLLFTNFCLLILDAHAKSRQQEI